MRIGVTLPMFREDPETTLAAARQAEELGIDGVFLFDHLWPIGQPGRPALSAFPVLGAVAVETATVAAGTLVARVGLVPDAVLVNQFATAARLLGDRLVAGLGAGDRLSARENEAYGVAYPPAAQRLAAVAAVADACRERGMRTWVGGTSVGIRHIALRGRHALNLWGADVAAVADAAADGIDVTWGGKVPEGTGGASWLRRLADAGASWAVVAFPPSLPALAEAAVAARG